MSGVPTLSLSLYCPKMAIYRLSGKLAQTAIEPMTATFSDGTVIENVTIPATYVDRVGPLRWLVRQCVGATDDGRLLCTIPPQMCELDLAEMGFAAKAIDAAIRYIDKEGRRWTGSVHFPDCEVQWWTNPLEAVPVTATGVLTQEP